MVSVSASSTPEMTGIRLDQLAAELHAFGPSLAGDGSIWLSGLKQDSRSLSPGELFAARAGRDTPASAFVAEALARGASAVLIDRAVELPALPVPVLRVSDVQRALGAAAEAVYGHPSRALPVIGITGTNGKTTTSYLLEQALGNLGCRPARLGTVGFAFDGVEQPSTHTTPEADQLSRYLASVRAAGGSHFVMEVSSHALELGRVAGLSFDVAAFSNLTQDHLDFHGSMLAYGAAKARLFDEFSPRAAVFNLDDGFGRELFARRSGQGLRALGVSQRGVPADVLVLEVRRDRAGTWALLSAAGRNVELSSRLIGAHNLDNLLLAFGCLLELGFEPAAAAEALRGIGGVPGRLERCDQADDDVLVVVDYAHTPDALERALDALRPLTAGALHCVFGCGGDRDPKKRPLMGAAVAQRADRILITNDNPRTEDPQAIVAAITPALATRQFVVELDRARAIELAVLEAAAGDVVLIAGKGHEDYQIFGERKLPFDDRSEARRALGVRRERGLRA